MTTVEITDEQYTAAIERLDRVYGADASEITEMIEAVRDEGIVHGVKVTGSDIYGETHACPADCVGCMTERIADAITKAVS